HLTLSLFLLSGPLPHPHSFPTRRSSDLRSNNFFKYKFSNSKRSYFSSIVFPCFFFLPVLLEPRASYSPSYPYSRTVAVQSYTLRRFLISNFSTKSFTVYPSKYISTTCFFKSNEYVLRPLVIS